MRLVATAFVLVLAMRPLLGCASLVEEPPPDPSGLGLACTNSVTTDPGFLDWQLGVSLDGPIVSGQPFTATLDGVAVFDEDYLDLAHGTLPEGLQEIDLVDVRATVHVRSGTTGDDDVALQAEAIPYECFVGRSACDPANDVLADPPKPPGLRGNTDCQPETDFNPCGRFIPAPISRDCDPGGVCTERGKAEQCAQHGSCVTGDLEIELEEKTAHYTADVRAEEILFGWDDESTGATLEPEGPNKGTWNLPPAVYAEQTGSNGVRVTLAGFPAAVECTMAVSCTDPDFAFDCPVGFTTRAPDEALISFRIQPEAL